MVGPSFFQPLVDSAVESLMWLIPLGIAGVALRALLVPWLRGREGEAAVGKRLRRIYAEVLDDIIIPDGRGGLTQIDHAALTGAGILLVETKNYSGSIYGTEKNPRWTQKLGRESHQFQNPLRQNHLHIEAVRALNLGVPVIGWVVFTGSSRFPKGMPAGVSQLGTLRRDLAAAVGTAPPSDAARLAWSKLKGSVRTDKGARSAHLEHLRRRHGPDRRTPAALALLVVSIVWMGGLWLSATPSARSTSPQAQPTAPLADRPAPAPPTQSRNPLERLLVPPDASAYAARMAATLLETPACAPYRHRLMEAGRGPMTSGATLNQIVQTLDAAREVGCRKPG